MKDILSVQNRARTAFSRNWREWAANWFLGEECLPELTVNLQPPREKDLGDADGRAKARDWVRAWRDCTMPGIEWGMRSWPSVGDQNLPVRVHVQGADQIARWAGESALWNTALVRLACVRDRVEGPWARSVEGAARPNGAASPADAKALSSAAVAVKLSAGTWCSLSDESWNMALLVWDWLFAHVGDTRYVRQLPIRGIDTKWIEQHGLALRPLYRQLVGSDFAFRQPAKAFRCKACDARYALSGCTEFSLSAGQMNASDVRPDRLVICENLVSALCLDDLPGTWAVHGSGFAVAELGAVAWLSDVPILYWGDLDSNGFAILNTLRSFAPHARSVMMDTNTLARYFDLCVDEPKPATGLLPNLTDSEQSALDMLASGDPARGIRNLRLEQERIEWEWATSQVIQAQGRISSAEATV